jgi:RHS repeat-associated protein
MTEQRRRPDRRESSITTSVGAPGNPERAAIGRNGGTPARERKIDVQKINQRTGAQVTHLRDMFEGPGQYGSATLSIPIPVTAARGFEPELALAYESTAGNGLFGQGMQIALSSVSRATNRHLPRYDGSDTFTLDGELLVPASTALQTRSVGGHDFTVACYRPRLEEAFQRIEYWRPVSGGPGFWRTLSCDDEIAIYGSAAEARIADPADPSRIFEWLIEAHFDPRGEAIRYRYKAEDDAGVPVTDSERGRSRDANRYPARISYGNLAPFAPADPLTLPDGPFLFDVLFDYGEYCIRPDNDTPATPVQKWTCRLDSFSNYSAGFERRTHRLCRHILVVHHFRQELGTDDAVVKVMALDYDETVYDARLVSVRAEGWWYQANRRQGEHYAVKTPPPFLLKWTELSKARPEFATLEIAAGTGLPRFGEPPPYALVDLDGCGLPGVLYADGATTAYVTPALTSADVNAALIYGSTPLPAFPIERIASEGVALADLDGSGRLSLSISAPPLAGFYPRAEDGGWQPFRAYPFALTDAPAPQVKFVDLTGDGRSDRLRVCSDELTYNPNLGPCGFGSLQRRQRAEGLPVTAPPPPNEDVRFADVLGGATVPAVLLRSGSLRCWPNLGYGRFGAPIDLAAPALPPSIGPDRVLLVDLTGAGYDDFVIALTDRLVIHRNQSGNGFATDAIEVMLPAPLRSMSQLRSADMAGLGCQALVFTSDDLQPQHWVLDIAGGRRPGLVAAVDDGQGYVVRIAYASSARFQLLDRLEGRPWITTLADPVFVVASVEHVDEIGGVTRVKDYRYSHGYYDPVEREFRGFGLIEIRERDAPRPSAAQSVGDAPPLLVREWYHTGATRTGESIEEAFANEYWHGDECAFPMPPSCFDWGQISPDAETWRQAVAALAGTRLRRESFAVGDPAAPFSVEASNALVRLEQPRIGDQAAVFLVTRREQVTSLYDGEAADPRVTHDINLEIDCWGDVALACQVAYARRAGGRDIVPEQVRTWIKVARDEFMQVRQGPDLWLARLPRQERRWNLPKPPVPTVRGLYYDFRTLRAAVESAIGPDGDGELLEWKRTVYVAEDGGEAPPGPVAAQALVVREETATFDPVELAEQFCGAEPPGGLEAFLAAQAYRFYPDNGLWWNLGLTQDFAGAEDFFLPTRTRDPFALGSDGGAGMVVTYAYDTHRLLIVATTTTSTGGDVLPHVTAALAVDYHTMVAISVRDANQKVNEILLDPLGDVIATSVYGWEWQNGSAVRTGFAPLPLDDPARWPVPPNTNVLVEHASDYLGGAASFHFIDWHSWKRERQPTHTAVVSAREYPTEQSAPPNITIDFIDGFGRPLQSKARTEPGTAYRGDATVNAAAAQRWATTGGRHYNGLGLPDRIYEPYFTDHWNYTADPGLNSLGVTSILHYDAAGRPIRTDYPKGGMAAAFFSLIVYASWSEARWDRDDTVKASNYYRAHIDPGHEPLPPWERDALTKAAAFDGTPRIDHFDARGLLVREEERLTQEGSPVSSLVTLHEYDADGMEIAQADPLRAAAGRWNERTAYDLAGDPVRTDSVDSGKRWLLTDALGNPAYTHDGRGTSTIIDHDGYRRPIATRVWTAGALKPLLAERFIYGDSLDSSGAPPLAEPDRRNLMGAVCVTFDGAGRTDDEAYALSGPVTDQTMRLTLDPRTIPDWTAAPAPTWAGLFAALDTKLQSERLRSTARFNALGNIVERSEPNGTTVKWRYQRPGLLAGIAAARSGEASQDYLAAVEYNARDQRISAQLKNADGALMLTEYRYDPDTFLLNGITTTRLADNVRLQDLTYWTDPVGNITHITDGAAPAAQVFHASQEVTPDQDFTYDSIYRLITNTGRAHEAYSLAMAADGGYRPYFPPPSARDARALEQYRMKYEYDDAGNLSCTHYKARSQWTQTLTMVPNSNRGAVTEGSLEHWFDDNGNQLKLGVGPTLAWTWADCLAVFTFVDRKDAEPDAEYYGYDAAGTRKRKVTRRATAGSVHVDETITMGGYTLHRRMRGEAIVEEWCSTRVADGDDCIVELFDWIAGTPPDGVATRQDRYQLSNLIGSSVMEVSQNARIISYEEYAPYGITVYAAGASLAEVSLKRFRFAGRSRDQATGLYYCGARYYAPWFGRWLSPDPAGDVDGLNLYAFVGGNPVSHVDIGGFAKQKASKTAAKKKKKTAPKTVKKTKTTKTGSKVTKKKTKATNTKKAVAKAKSKLSRGSFNSKAKALMEPGTDLAHRTSFQVLRDDLQDLQAGKILLATWKEYATSVVGSSEPELIQAIEDFANLSARTQDNYQTMLNRMNSATQNLRPGDSSLNRRLKHHQDLGTEDSRTGRTTTRDGNTERARSVSPLTRHQTATRLKLGGRVSLYVDKDKILASTYKPGMDVKDFEESITPSLGLLPGQKLTMIISGKKGNVRTYNIQ